IKYRNFLFVAIAAVMKKKKKDDSRIRGPVAKTQEPAKVAGWTFLTNHTHVLLCLYRNQEITLREVAVLVGITERMVQKIVSELVDAEYLTVTRVGRRNTYQIDVDRKLRHPLESHRSIGDMLRSLNSG
ncbi:MAG: winged helix-turn-helix transcriptional regulator, partial [Phycisphaerae bacterium]